MTLRSLRITGALMRTLSFDWKQQNPLLIFGVSLRCKHSCMGLLSVCPQLHVAAWPHLGKSFFLGTATALLQLFAQECDGFEFLHAIVFVSHIEFVPFSGHKPDTALVVESNAVLSCLILTSHPD